MDFIFYHKQSHTIQNLSFLLRVFFIQFEFQMIDFSNEKIRFDYWWSRLISSRLIFVEQVSHILKINSVIRFAIESHVENGYGDNFISRK